MEQNPVDLEGLTFSHTSKSYHRYEGMGRLRTVYIRKSMVYGEVPTKLIIRIADAPFGGSYGLKFVTETEHKSIYHGSHLSPIGIAYIDKVRFGLRASIFLAVHDWDSREIGLRME